MTYTEFHNHLKARGLEESTISQYLQKYSLFTNELSRSREPLSQDFINRFVAKHSTNITRTFLRHLFMVYGFAQQGFYIPQWRGSKPRKIYKTIPDEERKFIRKKLYENEFIFGLLFDLSSHCGLRRDEVLNICVEDFEWDDYEEGKPLRLLIKKTKRRNQRYVIVPTITVRNVLRYINKRSINHGRLTYKSASTWHRAFKKPIKKYLKTNYTLHDLRRTKATLWHEEGKDLINIKNRLGHKSIATTQLYINPDVEKELNMWEEEES